MNILMESDLIYFHEKLNYFRWYNDSVSSSALKKNLWLIEGAKILSTSNAYKLKIDFNNYIVLIRYWNKKIMKIKRGNLKIFIIFYFHLCILIIKNLLYNYVNLFLNNRTKYSCFH
jgi:hypothetical protein